MDPGKQKEILQDKIQGIIFGGALGDGVGLATEFMNKDTAKILYGNGPIKFGKSDGHEFWRDGHRRRWHENDFTDDTDQLLLILQCLLSTKGHLIPSQFAFRLKEWTEIGFPELENKACCGVGFTVGSVISHPEFLTNPHKSASDVWHSKGCDLAANGAVMRTSVLGIPFFFNEYQVVLNSIKAAKVTHADPRSIFSSVVVSVLISRILRKELKITSDYKIDENEKQKLLKIIMETNCSELNAEADISFADLCTPKPPKEPSSFFKSLCEKVEQLGKSQDKWPSWWPKHKDPDNSRLQNPVKCSPTNPNALDDPILAELVNEVVSDYKFLLKGGDEKITQKWLDDMDKYCFANSLEEIELDERKSIGYTLKCLGSALYSFSRGKKYGCENDEFFMDMITRLTLEAGDADTNGAVAGALLGARVGMKGLPKQWIQGLRHPEFLQRISNQLVELVMKQISSV